MLWDLLELAFTGWLSLSVANPGALVSAPKSPSRRQGPRYDPRYFQPLVKPIVPLPPARSFLTQALETKKNV